MKVVSFFRLKKGVGVILDLETNDDVDVYRDIERLYENLESNKKIQLLYEYDLNLMMPVVRFNSVKIHIPFQVLDLLYKEPTLHVFAKTEDSVIAVYLGNFELNVPELIRLDSVNKVLRTFVFVNENFSFTNENQETESESIQNENVHKVLELGSENIQPENESIQLESTQKALKFEAAIFETMIDNKEIDKEMKQQ